METICDFLALDHQRCERFFAQAQSRIAEHDWNEADSVFCRFRDLLAQHIRMEEKVLFPAFKQAMLQPDGPLAMLAVEHQRIRTIVERMAQSLSGRDAAGFFLHAETFVLLMREHHMKEEEMLYPLLDKVLDGRRGVIIRAMGEYIDVDSGTSLA